MATAFGEGKCNAFARFKRRRTVLSVGVLCLADSGYEGLDKLPPDAKTPKKKSKHHPLPPEEKAANREISRGRIGCEHRIGRLKVFKILWERYRNRRKRFGFRFILIAAICNLERGYE